MPIERGPGRLADAVRSGDAGEVERLLMDGADPNAADAALGSGWSAIHHAAAVGIEAITRVLLRRGASADSKDDYGRTPMMIAVAHGAPGEYYELLVGCGADPNATDWRGRTALFRSILSGVSPFAVAELVKLGATTEAVDDDGDTPLTYLLKLDGHDAESSIRALLENGADPNFADGHGDSPLRIAIDSSRASVVRMLLDRGADPNAPDGNGVSALMASIYVGDPEMFDVLLDAGAIAGPREYMKAVEILAHVCAEDSLDHRVIAGYIDIMFSMFKAGVLIDASVLAEFPSGSEHIVVAAKVMLFVRDRFRYKNECLILWAREAGMSAMGRGGGDVPRSPDPVPPMTIRAIVNDTEHPFDGDAWSFFLRAEGLLTDAIDDLVGFPNECQVLMNALSHAGR